MQQLALARKWRPKSFNDLIGQQHVVTALVNALTHNKLHHAYLLTGTRGVGKTTIARIFAKCLNCDQGVSATPCGQCNSCIEIDNGRFVDLYEIDAASRTKVEDTRDLLDNVQYAPTKGRYKVYLIDEVHMLSTHSFNALLKTLEEPPEHVKFILATTDPEKLPATVLSRCLQFHLLALLPEQIAKHCAHICQQEHIEAEDEALSLLADAANGSMRDALSLLDQAIAYGNLRLETKSMRDMLGTVDPSHLHDIVKALTNEDGDQLMAISKQLVSLGSDFSHVLRDLLSLFHTISVMQIAPTSSPSADAQIADFAKTIDAETLQLYYQIGLIGQRDLTLAPSLRAGFEMVLIRLLAFQPESTVNETSQTTTKPVTTKAASKTKTEKPLATASRPASQAIAKKPEQKANPPGTPWADWVNQMNLTGAALVLAQNCSLASQDDKNIHLHLSATQKPLLQKKYIDRINEALNSLLNKSLKLTMTVDDHISETPSGIAKQQREHNQKQAEHVIHNNEHVQSIVKNFDAEIISGSIVPNDEG